MDVRFSAGKIIKRSESRRLTRMRQMQILQEALQDHPVSPSACSTPAPILKRSGCSVATPSPASNTRSRTPSTCLSVPLAHHPQTRRSADPLNFPDRNTSSRSFCPTRRNSAGQGSSPGRPCLPARSSSSSTSGACAGTSYTPSGRTSCLRSSGRRQSDPRRA